MKVDFVVPRYGPVGGAENAVSALAKRVAKHNGWEVHLHATCAKSSNTWANEEEPGSKQVEALWVHQHLVDSGRTTEWSELDRRVQEGPSSIDATTQDLFFHHQGPVSNAMAHAVSTSSADLVIFAPYLFWPTIALAPTVIEKAVIVPAAHDEPFLRLSRVGEVLRNSRALIYGSRAEQRLLQTTHPIAHLPSTVLGWGIEEPKDSNSQIRTELRLDDRPYAICVGRIEHAKGALGLLDFWRTMRGRVKGNHRLVLLGEPSVPIEQDNDVVVVRGADDDMKWALLRDADFLINPSAMESFSLVLFEAWAAGIPVLVNGYCDTTREHVAEANGGLWYRNYGEFEVAVERLATDRELRLRLAANGQSFADEMYGWASIVDRFTAFCEHLS